MVTFPEDFKELQALVYLEMHHCPNLVDVQGLPWSLEYLDLGDCPKLIDIPSLRKIAFIKVFDIMQLHKLDTIARPRFLDSFGESELIKLHHVAKCTKCKPQWSLGSMLLEW